MVEQAVDTAKRTLSRSTVLSLAELSTDGIETFIGNSVIPRQHADVFNHVGSSGSLVTESGISGESALLGPASFAFQLLAGGGLCCCQPSRQHPERRARDIIQTHLVTELDRGWFPAMLAADADLQTGAGLAAAFGGHFDQLADSLTIQNCKGILLQNSFRQIGGQDLVHIVP